MRTSIASSADFSYCAELKPIDALPGRYNLEISTTWRGAKDPLESRRILQICLEPGGIEALRSILACARGSE